MKLTKAKLQALSDDICQHFDIPAIPTIINPALKRWGGLYHYDTSTELKRINIDTLLHELAHHLEWRRFQDRVAGYYKVEMWPKMMPCPDKPGWYAPTGKPEPVYLRIGRGQHTRLFKECLAEITDYYKETAGSK